MSDEKKERKPRKPATYFIARVESEAQDGSFTLDVLGETFASRKDAVNGIRENADSGESWAVLRVFRYDAREPKRVTSDVVLAPAN